MAETCESCGKVMKKVSTINSGNAIFETWQCEQCNTKKEKCVGLQ